jgi:signal transduction histidine kinase
MGRSIPIPELPPIVTATDGRPLAATLVGALAHPAVVVDGAGRVLGWNAAAEARLGVSVAAGRTIVELGLADLPGAVRLALSGTGADAGETAAIVAWSDGVPDAEILLQRTRALARLAPGVKHQGNNHLAGFAAFFGMLRTDSAFVAEYGTSIIRDLEENARRAPELLGAFAELARERTPAPAPQPLASRVAMALLLTEDAMDVRREVAVPDDLPEVLADASRLNQALVALLVNALDALGGPKARGHLAVSTTLVVGDGAPCVRLVIEDDAPVIPERDRPHLFDRIPPAGTCARAGLDLAVARRLIELDGGTLRYEAGPGGRNRMVATLVVSADQPLAGTHGRAPADRTRFWPTRSTLPRPPAAPHPDLDPVPAVSPLPDQLTVLVCDDEPALRDLMVRILERSRHRVLLAASAADALATLDTEHVDIVMSDHNMSSMTGVQLYAAASERHPRLRRRFVLMSGDPGEPAIAAFSSATGLPVLVKPFSFTELEATIRSLARG